MAVHRWMHSPSNVRESIIIRNPRFVVLDDWSMAVLYKFAEFVFFCLLMVRRLD